MEPTTPTPRPSVGDPDWWRTGVVYQIYPRSFADSNGDGVGDLPGIISRLDHLNGAPGSLGVDAIWLSPIYPSPDFDFGYDVADYVDVDPRYGTLADFDRLVAESHARGIRVVLDLVLNHSSHEHAWFRSSRASRTGPHADWYIWRDSPGRGRFGSRRPPNNWRSFFGGPAWTWDETRGQFYMHTFLPEQPDLNWRNPEVRAALLDVVRFWLARGVDGFRLDVFNVFFKDAALRSNPFTVGGRGAWSWQRHLHDRNQPELAVLLAELRAIVDEQPGRMTVGELFDGTIADAVSYAAPNHVIFDWALIGRPWNAAGFARSIAAREEVFGPDRWPANVLSNHDQPRHVSVFAGPRPGAPRDEWRTHRDGIAKVAAAMLLSLRGTAFLYYGEEIGQGNIDVPNDKAFDPPAQRNSPLFRWWNRDQCRGPIAWTGGPGGGFTVGSPWLPLTPDHEVRNVAAQTDDPRSVLSFYRELLALRRSTAALNAGSFALLEPLDRDVLAFRRDARDGAAAIVALNFGIRDAKVALPAPPAGRSWRVALSTQSRGAATLDGDVSLAPLEAMIALDG